MKGKNHTNPNSDDEPIQPPGDEHLQAPPSPQPAEAPSTDKPEPLPPVDNAAALLRIDEATGKPAASKDKKQKPKRNPEELPGREVIRKLAQGMFYSYPAYWVPDAHGSFIQLERKEMFRRVGRVISESGLKGDDCDYAFGECIHVIQNEQSVHSVGEFAGFPAGLHRSPKGEAILVTRSAILPEPKDGSWERINRLIVGLLGNEQQEYLLGHLSVFARHLYAIRKNPALVWTRQPVQAMVFAGPAGCGKTLLVSLISMLFGSRTANPYAHLIGKTNFAGECAAAEVLVIDDQAADPSPAARAHLATGIKSLLFAQESRIEAKYRQAVNVPKHSILIFCVNNEPEALMVLPTVDESLKDKISLFKASAPDKPYSSDPENRQGFFAGLVAELPCFLHYLLNEHVIRQELRQHRTGIVSFHHLEILDSIKSLAPELELLEMMLDHFRKKFVKVAPGDTTRILVFKGKASKLQDELERNESLSKTRLRQLLKYSNSAGNYLATLSKTHPKVVKLGAVGRGTRSYEVHLGIEDYTEMGMSQESAYKEPSIPDLLKGFPPKDDDGPDRPAS